METCIDNDLAEIRHDWLSRRIAALELTHEQFSAHCGVEKSVLLSWLHGRSTPRPIDVHRLATAFGCPVGELDEEFAKERWIGARGKWLRTMRRRRCLSQEDLAERIGVSRNAVQNWERDRRAPTFRNLRLLAEALHVPVTEASAAYQELCG